MIKSDARVTGPTPSGRKELCTSEILISVPMFFPLLSVTQTKTNASWSRAARAEAAVSTQKERTNASVAWDLNTRWSMGA